MKSNKVKEQTMTQSLTKLNAQAEKLYNLIANSQVELVKSASNMFLEQFEPLQLAKLWHTYCVYSTDENGKLVGGASYDDEVYDALDLLGYWDMV